MLSHQICKRLRWRVELRYVGAERSEEMYLLTSDPFVMCHRVKDGEEGDLSQSFGDRIYWSDVRLEGEKVVRVRHGHHTPSDGLQAGREPRCLILAALLADVGPRRAPQRPVDALEVARIALEVIARDAGLGGRRLEPELPALAVDEVAEELADRQEAVAVEAVEVVLVRAGGGVVHV